MIMSSGTTSASDVAFGSLIDLALLRTGAVSGEVCEACNTINLGASRFCKGCSHRLPDFYAAGNTMHSPAAQGATALSIAPSVACITPR